MGLQSSLSAAAIAATLAISGPAFAQEATQLRERISVSGPAVTLGDIFINAGAMAGRAVAPSPGPGQTARFSARFVSAAAAAAGLAWTPDPGLVEIAVTRVGGRNGGFGAGTTTIGNGDGEAGVRRGDSVTLVYIAPGLQLTTRARALSDGALGAPIRVVNLQSNMTVDAIVTGPGSTSASPRN